jgi:hypothetical protein
VVVAFRLDVRPSYDPVVVEEITALQERLLLAFEAMKRRHLESLERIEETRRLIRRSRARRDDDIGPASGIRRRAGVPRHVDEANA